MSEVAKKEFPIMEKLTKLAKFIEALIGVGLIIADAIKNMEQLHRARNNIIELQDVSSLTDSERKELDRLRETESKLLQEIEVMKERERLRKLEHSPGGTDYEEVGNIGKGAFGEVFLWKNRQTGTKVAVKKIKYYFENGRKPAAIEKLENEISILSTYIHRRILNYIQCGIFDDLLCIIVEYMESGSVRQEMDVNKAALSVPLSCWYMKQILEGVQFLHQSRIVHRNLKCSNILLDGSGNIKISDFCIAKRLNQVSSASWSQTSMSTFNFMAPELFDSEAILTASCDIWSVGCCFVEMLTSRPPWYSLNSTHIAGELSKRSKPVYQLAGDSMEELEDFLRFCLAYNPKERKKPVELLSLPLFRIESCPPENEKYVHVAYIEQRQTR